jgi:hypothetical protein
LNGLLAGSGQWVAGGIGAARCAALLAAGDSAGAPVADLHAEVGRGVEGVGELKLVEGGAAAVVADDGEVEVGPDGVRAVAVLVAGVAEEGALLHELVARAGWEGIVDVAVAVAGGHVGIVEPDLAPLAGAGRRARTG